MNAFFREHRTFIIIALIVLIGALGLYYSNPQYAQKTYPGETMESSRAVMDGEAMVQDMAYGEESARMGMDAPEPYPPSYDDQGIDADERRIIRTSSLTVRVDEPEETFDDVQSYVESIDGFVENATISEEPVYHPYYDERGRMTQEQKDQPKQVSATIRVPAEELNAAIERFKGYGVVLNESISGQDVTATYQDLEARLENLRARQEKLLEFYDQAEDVEDTLRIFEQLEQVRFQIEQLEQQSTNLERRTTFATIYLTLQPTTSIEPFSDGEWNLEETWNSAINGMKVALRDIAEGAIALVVYSVIWLPILIVLWVIYMIVKRRKKGAKSKSK